jgi:hypothetical protein
MDLVVDVYELTRTLPASELYGLASQMRRAAASVASNIAEGNGRFYRKEYAHHFRLPLLASLSLPASRFPPPSGHSVLNATTGSTRVARRAGMSVASTATNRIVPTAAPNASGSRAGVSNNSFSR